MALRGLGLLVGQLARVPPLVTFPGQWTAPGGKVDPGESPVECAARELREETGLRAPDPVLRGVITETSPRAVGDHRHIDMPAADHHFFAPVVLGDGRPYERTFHYDGDLRLLAG